MFDELENKKYCMYCKDLINDYEAHVVFDGDNYHMECFQQMNTFGFNNTEDINE